MARWLWFGLIAQYFQIARFDAGVARAANSAGNVGANWIQIHVSHGCKNRFFREQGLAFETAFPESAGDFVFDVGFA